MTSSKLLSKLFLITAAVLAVGCSSANQVDLRVAKRFLGRENDVRVDAQLSTDQIDNASFFHVVYEVENLRSTAIALAVMATTTDYDPATQTITLNIGCEVPAGAVVPRLTRIESSERKGFSVGAKVHVLVPAGRLSNRPRYLRVKLHFLGDVEPFETLLSVPERGVQSAELADRLFPAWIENKETVITNVLPIHWSGETTNLTARMGGGL